MQIAQDSAMNMGQQNNNQGLSEGSFEAQMKHEMDLLKQKQATLGDTKKRRKE